MLRMLPLVIAVPLTIAVGVLDGLWTNRWQMHGDVAEAAARLETVPADVGEWTSESLEMNPREVKRAELRGYLKRSYTNRRTGQTITVLLLCGQAGPISTHPPEICCQSRGYSMEGNPVAFNLPRGELAPSTELRTACFCKNGPDPAPFRIFWTLSAGQSWSSPASPRVSFAREPFLYKLYVVQSLAQRHEPLEQSPVPEFLSQLLPQLEQYLFTAPEAPAGTR